MGFRFRAFALHVAASALLLGLTIGTLYLGWYRWPGWFLAGSLKVTLIMAGVDVVLGPLLTLVVAAPKKPRKELARDLSVIVALQLIALGYGSYSLWNGRPLYYVFSEKWLTLVQAYDIEPAERQRAAKSNPDFAPHFYSLPRWVSAPPPADPNERQKLASAGGDVSQMPRFYQSFEAGTPALKSQLRQVDDINVFILGVRNSLKMQMAALKLPLDQPNSIALSGRGGFLLAVFDSNTHLVAILKP